MQTSSKPRFEELMTMLSVAFVKPYKPIFSPTVSFYFETLKCLPIKEVEKRVYALIRKRTDWGFPMVAEIYGASDNPNILREAIEARCDNCPGDDCNDINGIGTRCPLHEYNPYRKLCKQEDGDK